MINEQMNNLNEKNCIIFSQQDSHINMLGKILTQSRKLHGMIN